MIRGRSLGVRLAFARRAGPGGAHGRRAGGRRNRVAGRMAGVADGCWIAGTLVALVPAVLWVLAALRRGRAGVDLIAVLSLVGTLLVGEYLAGALIAVMLAGGRALEAAAERRASHDLRALLEHAPRFARRRIGSEVTCDTARRGGGRRSLGRRPGRSGAGGRAHRRHGGRAGRIGAHRRAAAGRARLRRAGPQRCGQRGQRVRVACHRDRAGQHVRGHRAVGRTSRSGKRADRAAGRPVRRLVPTVGAADGGRGVVGERVCRTSGRGLGRRDSLPTVARCAGGDRLGVVARLASGCGDPQRRRVGKPRACNDSGDGQDRHSHHGTSGRGRDLDRTGT